MFIHYGCPVPDDLCIAVEGLADHQHVKALIRAVAGTASCPLVDDFARSGWRPVQAECVVYAVAAVQIWQDVLPDLQPKLGRKA